MFMTYSQNVIDQHVSYSDRYVRMYCSLCGMKMFDLHLCLSASVNVRYVLHT
jgi:hypothetical protein